MFDARPTRIVVLIATGLLLGIPQAFAQTPERASLEVEGGGFWLPRNDVRIREDTTATEDATDDLQLAVGYRTIEGGADAVFNFAWLNFGVVSARFGF